MTLQLDTAELAGTLLESMLYGIALILGQKTISTFHRMKKRTGVQPSIAFVLAPWMLLLSATMHLAIDWHRMFMAFIDIQSREERIAFLSNARDWSSFFKGTLFVVQMFFADSILVYRCFLLWERNYYIVALLMLVNLGTLVCGMTAVGFFSSYNLFFGPVRKLVIANWITTVFTNVLATALILLRLFLSQRSRKGSSVRMSLTPVILVLFESGAVYCVTCLVDFGLFLAKSNGNIVILNVMTSLIVVLFSFVLLRISRTVKVPEKGEHSESVASTPPTHKPTFRYIAMTPLQSTDDKRDIEAAQRDASTDAVANMASTERCGE